MLGRKVQHRPAGDDDLQVGTGGEEAGDTRRGPDDLLEIVEDQQHVAVLEEGDEHLLERTVAQVSQTERLGDRGDDKDGVMDRRQVDEGRPRRQTRGRCPRRPEGRGGSCPRHRDRSA